VKSLLLALINLYWVCIPESKRRKCLFKTSCSNYVYTVTKTEGFFSGIKALRFRVKNCNPNYSIISIDGEKILVTKTNQILKKEELNNNILI